MGAPGSEAFAAFISYRHVAADTEWADRLQRAIETFRTPPALVAQGVPERAGRVFQDTKELAASSDLSAEIDDALRRSRFLIVICSPRAVESKWIAEEIHRFRELGRGDRILPLLVEGEPSEAFPAALTGTAEGQRIAEPLAADARPAKGVSTRQRRRDATLRVLARLLDCKYDELRQRDAQRQRTRSLALTAILALVGIALGTLAFVAVRERNRADVARLHEAEAKNQALHSLGHAFRAQAQSADDPFQAVLCAARSVELLDEPESRGALIEARAKLPALPVWRVSASHRAHLDVAWKSDDTQCITAGGIRSALVWDLKTRRAKRQIRSGSDILAAAYDERRQEFVTVERSGVILRTPFDTRRDATRVKVNARLGAAAIDTRRGRFALTSGLQAFWFDPDAEEQRTELADDVGDGARLSISEGGLCALAEQGGRVRIFDARGNERREVRMGGRPTCLAFQGAGRLLVGTQHGAIYRVPVSDADERLLEEHPSPVVCIRTIGSETLSIGRDGTLLRLGRSGRETLALPTEDVTSASISPSGDLAMVLRSGRILQLLDLRSPAVLGHIDEHEHSHRNGYALAVPSNEAFVVAGPQSGLVCFYEGKSGRPLPSGARVKGQIEDVLFLRDDSKVAVAQTDGGVTLVDVSSRKIDRLIKKARSTVHRLLDLNSRGLLVAGRHGRVDLLDVGAGEVRHEIEIKGRALALATDRKQETLAVGTDAGKVYLYDLAADGTPSKRWSVNFKFDPVVPAPVRALRWSGHKLQVFGDAMTAQELDGQSGKTVRSVRLDLPLVGAVAENADGTLLAVGSRDGRIQLRDPISLDLLGSFPAHASEIRRLAFGAQSGDLYSTAMHDDVARWRLWPLRSFTTIPIVQVQSTLRATPDGKGLLTTGMPGLIFVRDRTSGVITKQSLSHPGLVLPAAFSPDGTELASLAWDRAGTRRWHWPSLEPKGRIATGKNQTALAYIDASRIAIGGRDGLVRIHDLESGKVLREEKCHTASLTRLVYHPGTGRLIGGARDHTLSVIDLSEDAGCKVLANLGADVAGLAMQPGGTLIAASTMERQVHLFDIESLGRRGLLLGHGSPVLNVRFSEDGQMLFSTDYAGLLRVWDAEHETLLAQVQGPLTGFGPIWHDAKRDEVLVAALRSGRVYGFDLSPLRWPAHDCVARMEKLLHMRLVGTQVEPLPWHRLR